MKTGRPTTREGGMSMKPIKIHKKSAVRIAFAYYVSDPCSICQQPLTMEDFTEGRIVSDKNREPAHQECWTNVQNKKEGRI
jgi:hypothetical protein